MDLKQLTAVVTIAEVGSVTKAAKLLHVVQPALTRQVKALETELGVELFDRTRQGMTPTPEGRLLVERARRALLELDRARAEVQPAPTQVRGIVTLGVLESTIDVLVEPVVEVLGEEFPGIELRVLSAYSGHLQQWLDTGDVDLSLLYDLAETPSMSVVPLLEESLWVLAPAEAGLEPATPVPWSTVWSHPMVMPVAGHGLRILMDQARSASGATPTVSVQANSMAVQKRLVAAGMGWTVLPAAGVASDVARGLFSVAPLVEPEVTRSVVLGLPRSGRLAPPVEVVAAVVTRTARALVRSGEWPSARAAEGS